MYPLIVFVSLFCLVEVTLIVRALFFFKANTKPIDQIPFVSILVAARNEEQSIARCIQHLQRLHYPEEKIELLIGNDQSSDKTRAIVEELAQEDVRIRLVDIIENNNGGKAKVLEELAKRAKGEMLLITDADTFVPEHWVRSLLSGLDNDVGIVNGATLPMSNKWQKLDWLLAIGFLKVFDDLNLPVTAIGNNMLVTREAYNKAGGYENIPFSVTEDYQLFKYIRKEGYASKQLFEKGVMAETLPKISWGELLQQRKRWMKGAFSTKWYHLLFLVLQAFYYPAVIILTILSWQIGLKFLVLKALLQGQLMLTFAKRLKIRLNPIYVLLFEFYSAFVALLSLLYYFMPTGVKWKDRTY